MNIELRALADGGVQLDIFDAIGPQFWGVTTQQVAALLKEHKGKPLTVRVNSPGGDATTGAAIYNLLRAHGNVTVDVIGLAASAASVIAMAGERVRVAENALMMIHDPWVGIQGDAQKLRAAADRLEKDAEALATSYARKTGKSADELREMMRAETWMTASEAVEHGFADEVLDALPVAACIRPEHAAIFGGEIPDPVKAFAVATQSSAGIDHAIGSGASAVAVASPWTIQAPSVVSNPGEEIRAATNNAIQLVTSPNDSGHAPAEQPADAGATSREEEAMPIAKQILMALALAEDADEAAVTQAISQMKSRADLGREVEIITGHTGSAAVGAVRALKESAAKGVELNAKIAEIETSLHRRDFDAAIAEGTKGPKRKLTPAQARHWGDRFEAACKENRGAEVVEELRGYLAVSPVLHGLAYVEPMKGSGDAGVLQHNGKSYAQMSGAEKHALKRENPDLFEAMREDARAKGQL